MAVINNTTLLVRRIGELQRRRSAMIERQDRMRRVLPEWAFAPLQLAGMSSEEIRSMMSDLSKAETEAGLDQVEHELEGVEQQIEELENQLLTTPAASLDSVQAVLDLTVTRFRSQVVTDPNDLFYDYGEARMLAFLERATDDLRGMLVRTERYAS